jgi:hypothetical protein
VSKLEKFQQLKGQTFKRRKDTQQYKLGMNASTDWKGRMIVHLYPVWSGRAHWKTWERFLAEYETYDGEALAR